MDLSHSTDILKKIAAVQLGKGPQIRITKYRFTNSGGQHQLEKQAEHEKFVLGPAAEGVPV